MDSLSAHHLGDLQLTMLHIQALTSYSCPHSLLGHCISPHFSSSSSSVFQTSSSYLPKIIYFCHSKNDFLVSLSLQNLEITGADLFTEHGYVLK